MATEEKTGTPVVNSVTLPANGLVDLHMHSPYSDGFWTAETLPAAAAELGIKVLALTDHDDYVGVPEMAQACAARGIYLIPALEMSTYFAGVGYHMLAYNVDMMDGLLRARVEDCRNYYDDMVNQALLDLEKQGKPMDPAKSERLSVRPIKLYHIVDALVDNGYAKHKGEAYSILNSVGAYYGWSTPMEEAIKLVHGAGGVTVIAHPGRAEPGFTAATASALDGMRAAGLDGVEAYHSYHTPTDTEFYLRYAQKHNMLVGTGSDTHGPGQSRRMLTPWPATLCRDLLQACGIAVTGGQ